MGLKGLRFLGILIATYLLISSEVAARELAEAPIARDPVYGFANGLRPDSGEPPTYVSSCEWGCCGWAYDYGCICCSNFSQADRHAKLP